MVVSGGEIPLDRQPEGRLWGGLENQVECTVDGVANVETLVVVSMKLPCSE